jgi:hypothetical protein
LPSSLAGVIDGAQTVGRLLEVAFETSSSMESSKYEEQVRQITNAGLLKIGQETTSQNLLTAHEIFRKLASNEQIDERSILRLDQPAELIAQTIRQIADHIIATRSTVTQLQRDPDLLYSYLAETSRICDLDIKPEQCDFRVYPLAIHILVPSQTFSRSSVTRGRTAAHVGGTVCSFFDREYLRYEPSVERHEMMHSFNAAFLEAETLYPCGSASIRTLRVLRLHQNIERRPFPTEVLGDLWKEILCDLHDELLADAAQLSLSDRPPARYDESVIRSYIAQLFKSSRSRVGPFIQRGRLLRSASLKPFNEAVQNSGVSTAGVAISQTLSDLRNEFEQHTQLNRPEIVKLAETTALQFCRSVNSLFSAVHNAFQESRQQGYLTLGAATLLNPWQFHLLHEIPAPRS